MEALVVFVKDKTIVNVINIAIRAVIDAVIEVVIEIVIDIRIGHLYKDRIMIVI